MIGSSLPEMLPHEDVPATEGLELNFKDTRVTYKSQYALNGRITVPGGRIVGVAGISGNGQSDLMRAISGEAITGKETVKIFGQYAGDLSVKHRRAQGLRYVPEERLSHATVPEMSLESNSLLTSNLFLSKGFMRNKMLKRYTEHVIEDFKVKAAGTKAPASSLSGGNLQKYIIGREILHNPTVLVVNQPTWGVDVGAAALIRNTLIEKRTAGTAILVISEEIDELFEVCDELVVMSQGKISPQVKIKDVTVDQVGRWMGGMWNDENERQA